MTKIAVISDIHANIKGLELALKDMEKRGIDKIICLGDLVTKYFYPDKVVDAIKENCDLVIKGNCDNLVSTDARYKYARSKLGTINIEYLLELPIKDQLLLSGHLINFFHAAPLSLNSMFNPLFDNENTKYAKYRIDDYQDMFIPTKDLCEKFKRYPQISICGHTHQSYIGIVEDNNFRVILDNKEQQEKDIVIDSSSIINVGSVGEPSILAYPDSNQPFLIDRDITYLILEGDIDSKLENGIKVEMVKVPYHETLKKVYFDMLIKQARSEFPFSPNDTKKVRDSLLLIEENEIEKRSVKYV